MSEVHAELGFGSTWPPLPLFAVPTSVARSFIVREGEPGAIEHIREGNLSAGAIFRAAFQQMAWLDMRTTSGSYRITKDFPNLPAWIVKAVGGSTTHWSGATPRFMACLLYTSDAADE